MGGKAKHTFLLAGNGSYSNRGCEAIVRSTVAVLNQQLGPCTFHSAYFRERGNRDAVLETDRSIAHHPIPAMERFDPTWFRRQASRVLPIASSGPARYRFLGPTASPCEAVLMVGGDNYTMENSRPDEHFALSRFFLQLGKPVVLWGASVGPFSRDPAYEAWAAAQLRRLTLICARETSTYSYLRAIGVEKNVRLVADPAFLLEPSPVELADDIDRALRAGCVGLNLSPLIGRFRWGRDIEAWIHSAAHILEVIPCPLILVPHVTSPSGRLTVRADDVFLRRVWDAVGAPSDRLFLLGASYKASELKWIIGRLRAFAGARTHSTIAALSSGVPTMCIGYSLKAEGVARDVYGDSHWLLPVEELDGPHLAARYAELLHGEDTVRGQLSASLPLMRHRAVAAAECLRELL